MPWRTTAGRNSDDSIRFADGRRAEPPIAACEHQGYVYDARLRFARLAREIYDDPELADRLERDAASLRRRFNRDFWLPRRGHYALALDRDKQPVDSLTSNVGHLLWSGIVDERRAGTVVRRLLRDDLLSGWGIRSLSSQDAAYSPLEYHNGTVWPHDTAIVAEGMRRYGSATRPGASAKPCSGRPRPSATSCPRSSPVFPATPRTLRWGTRPRSSRRPGRQAPRCWRCGRCSASTPRPESGAALRTFRRRSGRFAFGSSARSRRAGRARPARGRSRRRALAG